LVAFESFKEAEAKLEARKQRKSFQALIEMDAFGIHVKSFNKEILQELRARMENDKAKVEHDNV
jgi:TRAP-type mannitol/chloroaromatic compound transport system substrate-binding protein